MVKHSIKECQLECTSRKSCKLIKFCRHLNWCEVHTEEASACVDARKCVVVRRDAMGNINDKCNNCNENQVCDSMTGACSIQACEPLDLPNGKVLGNSRIVGAPLDIACNGGFREINGILQVYCTSSGTWDKSPSCQRVCPDSSQQLEATWSAKLSFGDNTVAVTKDVANSTCQKLGPTSSLVKLDEISKFNYIVELLQLCSGSYWVDGVNDVRDSLWKFSDGRLMPMDVSMWFDSGPKEQCVRMEKTNNFRLTNIDCPGITLHSFNYICETPVS